MKKLIVLFYAVVVFSLSQACLALGTDGDRGHNLNMIYPDDAFLENSGPIIDITKSPYNAKGSGNPVDADHNTKAFIAVYDFIMEQLDKYGDIQRKVTSFKS